MVLNTIDMNMQVFDKKLTACILLLLLELFIDGAESAASQAEIDQHIELGRQFLVAGQLSDALTHYHAAIEGDPHNYMTYFQRGTVYLALGKAKFAMKDFIKVLEIKPDFTAARYQLATVYMKIGDYDTAEHELYQVLQIDPYHQDATYWHSKVAPARDQYVYILDAVNNNNHHHAIQMITQSLEISPWSKELREMRADSYVAVGDVLSAIPDMRSVNRLTQDSTEGYYKLSHLLYQLGHVTDSLKEVRECLKLDPEHKECFPHYKKVKKVEKALTDSRNYLDAEQFEDAIDTSERVLKMESEIPLIIFSAKQILCSAHVKAGKYSEAIAHCREALELSKDPSVLCDRAEAYIETDMFDDAIHDYHAALEIDEHNQRAKEGLEKAKARQKQAERRDYYKILGVSRKATKQEIVKAYRQAAKKWHPDNYQGDQKKIAEKKFVDVAAAKEVLTDEKKRQQFDAGEDPLDPEAGQGGFRGQNPFQHFHHGSPFQFKFHFN